MDLRSPSQRDQNLIFIHSKWLSGKCEIDAQNMPIEMEKWWEKMQCLTWLKKQTFELYIYVYLIERCKYAESRGFLLRVGVGGCKSRVEFALRLIGLVCARGLWARIPAQKAQYMRGQVLHFFFSLVTVLKLKRLVTAQINDQNVFGFYGWSKTVLE